MADVSYAYCRNCHERAMNYNDDDHLICAWCDKDCCYAIPYGSKKYSYLKNHPRNLQKLTSKEKL